MRRVAGELGIAVMPLYAYVPAKDHLAGPPRSQDDIFDSCIERLTDLAGLRTRRATAVGDRTS